MSRVNGPDEEQFVLRLPPDVAERVRAVLRESPTARPEDNDLQLRFMGARQSTACTHLARNGSGHLFLLLQDNV